MITKPTLFILGAGASIPYGFPSGWELRNKICEAAQGIDAPIVLSLNTAIGVPCEDIIDFARRFKQSRLISIDTFLSKRPEYSRIGKTLIAYQLIPKELDYNFDNLNTDDDWYCALWNALASNARTVAELTENKIKIFTFNYDRSLERYLHTAIMNTFNVSEGEALDGLKHFDIQHVYGSLGVFGISDDYSKNIRAYSGLFDRNSVNVAIESLRVIPEARAEDSVFQKVQEAFVWADHVCFLGFGFDALNIQRLGFKGISQSQNGVHVKMNKNIVTSSFGKTRSEMEIAHAALFDSYNHFRTPVWDFAFEHRNLETLRNFAWLLT
ncbi:hypothetical protein [Methylophilus sp. Q8]|uniref:hypothetical protein n=1 Tax=Methylophilus sp. Q8 TaxID=1506586 RepID=UPI0006482578|nr:hypothetical protein [Methylophilus sp. Q8]